MILTKKADTSLSTTLLAGVRVAGLGLASSTLVGDKRLLGRDSPRALGGEFSICAQTFFTRRKFRNHFIGTSMRLFFLDIVHPKLLGVGDEESSASSFHRLDDESHQIVTRAGFYKGQSFILPIKHFERFIRNIILVRKHIIFAISMPKDLEIVCGRYIGETQPCFIIAEIGQNHQGDVDIAKQLIKVAKESGADCVKFQKSCLKEKFTKAALARKYESPNSWGKTYREHKEYLEFNKKQMQELQDYSENGMDVVREGYRRITAHHSALVLLQCTSAYPTPPCEMHLRVMQSYTSAFPKAHIGLSSHEEGIAISIAAVAMGARVLERHITLCRSWRGSDHASSLDPEGLKELIKAIRSVELALGSPLKEFQFSEVPCKTKLGKSIVAARSLTSGAVIDPDTDLKVKVAEPSGAPASNYYDLKGCVLLRDTEEDEPIVWRDVKKPQVLSSYWDTFLEVKRKLI
ncbi:hypothetical protein B566_EDAN013218 [Ephemera danica]|nr:hypothetical protein B566_EDAN013218 [Ephemera danica]